MELQRRTRRNGSSAGFAVLDLETTGLTPSWERVVEVAVVHVDPDGSVGHGWSTLVHPGRASTGKSDLHGITADDVRRAPRFEDVVPELLPLLHGRVLVAHNARFDLPFLAAELLRSGVAMPEVPHLCTLRASWDHLPRLSRRRLQDCCEHVGIPLEEAHAALADATATACLLSWYLSGSCVGRGWAAPLLADAASTAWPDLPTTGAVRPMLPRPRSGALRPVPAEPGRFTALLEDLPLDSPDLPLPEAAGYLEVLAAAMADGVLTDEEVDQLVTVATSSGLTRAQVDAAHRGTLMALARAAVADGVVSRYERADLLATASALGFAECEVSTVLDEASAERRVTLKSAAAPLPEGWALGDPLCVGDRVVFTGGTGVGRAKLELAAKGAGLRVMSSVSRFTALLVTDDAASGSGKARRSLELGTRVVDCTTFAEMVQHVQAATEQRVPAPRDEIAQPRKEATHPLVTTAASAEASGASGGAGPAVYAPPVLEQPRSSNEEAHALPAAVRTPAPVPPEGVEPRWDPPAPPAHSPVFPPPAAHVTPYLSAQYPAVPSPLKDTGVAYLLWFFLGGFGGHHFYLRRPGRAATVLVLTVVGWLTAVLVVGFLLLAAVGIWLIVDACLMPGRIRQLNHRIATTNAVAQQQDGSRW